MRILRFLLMGFVVILFASCTKIPTEPRSREPDPDPVLGDWLFKEFECWGGTWSKTGGSDPDYKPLIIEFSRLVFRSDNSYELNLEFAIEDSGGTTYTLLRKGKFDVQNCVYTQGSLAEWRMSTFEGDLKFYERNQVWWNGDFVLTQLGLILYPTLSLALPDTLGYVRVGSWR